MDWCGCRAYNSAKKYVERKNKGVAAGLNGLRGTQNRKKKKVNCTLAFKIIRLRNDLLCVEWDVNPSLAHFQNQQHCNVKSEIFLFLSIG